MGNIHVPLKTLFRELDVEMIVPPPNSRRTLSLGSKHSPEWACIPFKITLGNFIEALELGADTLVMAAGPGLCRFGYYARVQEQILRDMGYDFTMHTTELFEGKIVGVARLVKTLSNDASTMRIINAIRFSLAKLGALDEVERVVHRVRAVELEQGSVNRVFQEAIDAIDEAGDNRTLNRAKTVHVDCLNNLPKDPTADPIVMGVIGEFYVVLEPFSNMDVEVELGKLGVEVRRSTFVSEWTKFSLFLNAFGVSEKDRIHEAAQPYLRRDVGGDGWETIGEKVLHVNHYDGLIHLAPFTCMPELVAQNIMPSVKKGLPVLTIICDEQMGRAGMLTRLEAFVDLLRRRRDQRRSAAGVA
jgi:predicted nucleotide-binding protein (sugar kinase/HSP70/actin superfamily)